MAEKTKDRLSFLLDSYLQGREDSTELLYGGRIASQRLPDSAKQPEVAQCQQDSALESDAPQPQSDAPENSNDRMLSILDDFLEETGAGSDVLELGMPAQDYVRKYLEEMPDAPVNGLEKDIRDKTGLLLDAFLAAGADGSQERLRPVNGNAEEGNSCHGGKALNDNISSYGNAEDLQNSNQAWNVPNGDAAESTLASDSSVDLDSASRGRRVDEAFFTETLAEIFMKQHRYDKALEIIRSLYLNFPNKSIYFADQIRYLEKLIRINQISK